MKSILTFLFAISLTTLSFSQSLMTPELLWELGRVSSPILSEDGKAIYFTIRYYDLEENKGQSQIYTLPLKGGKMKKLTEIEGGFGNLMIAPNGKLNFAKGGQLWEYGKGNTSKQISNFVMPLENISYSKTNSKILGTISQKIQEQPADAYSKYKKANVKIYDGLMYRHWSSWSKAEFSHPAIVSSVDGKMDADIVDIMPGEFFDVPMKPFGGAEDLTWNPNGTEVIYQSKKKSGIEYATSTNSDLYQYNLETKKTYNLTKGRSGYDSNPLYNATGGKIAWLSMARDGYESDKNDIIILDLEGGEEVNISEKWNNTISSFVWSNDGKKIFFLASINATNQIFEINLPDNLGSIDPKKHFRQITDGQFNYNSILESGADIFSLRQDMNNASEIYSVNIKTGAAKQISHVNDELYKEITRSKVEKRMVKTTDGKDMLTWVIYPPNFDPNKKYPTLLYCQGGPQSAVSQFYSFRWNFQLMAAAGYIIVAPNRRGLPGFGVEWNEAISKDWGGQAMKDYFSAIDELSKESYVDESRVGAIGASYGGYSVYMLAGIHENRFKTFISHCGLFNLESWYGTTEELFFANWDIGGAYYEKVPPVSYAKHSPHKYVANWNTPMLVFHGGKDFRVPEGQGMEAFNAAQQMRLKSRFVYFPEESHWILSPQNGIVWHSEFFKWLKETL